jgi:ABC-type Na+ efflux pump permease subunit
MRSVLAIARHDLRLTLADRGALVWLFLLPVVFATFFGLVFGSGSAPAAAVASLVVVDLDQSPASRFLVEALEGEGVDLTELTAEERADAEGVIRALVIPEGLAAGIAAGDQQTIRLEKTPGASQEASLVAQARIVTAIARLLGRLVEAEQQGDTSDWSDAERPPDLVTMEVAVAGTATVVPGGFAQSIPGNGVMFALLVALTYGAASVSAERSSGNLRRLVTAPVSRGQIIIGKIAGRFVVSALQITVLVATAIAGSAAFGIFIGDHPLQMWLVLLLFGAAVAPLGVAVGGWISDPDRAASVGVIATLVMAAFGGCWWPLEVVSKPLQTVALLFPTGWAMEALHGLVSFGRGLGDLRLELAVLVGFGLVFTAIAWRSLRVE